jgi:hypothetical protein
VGSEADEEQSPEPKSSPETQRRRHLWERIARSGGVPLLATAAVVTILVVGFQTIFLTSDDSAITAIANGDFTGKRSSSLVVAPAMWGHMLRVGYSLFPHLPWDGILLYALQIILWSAIAAAAFTLRRRPPVAERIVVAAVMVSVVPWVILRVSFTTTSLLIGVVGIIVFAIGAKAPGRIGTTYTVVGGMLLGVADFIRVSSFLGLLVVFAPVMAIIAFRAGFRRSLVFVITVGIFATVSFGTNHLEYSRTPQWSAFMKMNSARGALQQTPRLYAKNVSTSALVKLGWTHNDLYLFADDLYPDPKVYTDQDIRQLAVLSPLVRHSSGVSYIYDILRHSSDDGSGPVVSALAVLAIAIALRRSRRVALLTILASLWAAGALAGLLLYVRLPGRVGVPFEAGVALCAAIVPAYLASAVPARAMETPDPRKKSAMPPLKSFALIAVVVLFTAGPIWNGIASVRSISRVNRSGVQANQTLLARLEAFDPKGIFIGRGDYFGTWVQPLSSETQYTDPSVVPLGWATNSPLFEARLARLGITNLYGSLATNPHVHLLGVEVEAQGIQLFFFQHRGVREKVTPSVELLPHQFGATHVTLTLWTFTPKKS